MRVFVWFVPTFVISACAQAPPAQTPAPPEDDAIYLTVENATPVALAVFFTEPKAHTRLGIVDPRSVARLRVGIALLKHRTWFRVYAFRGPEPCPVARMIDLAVSRTPRIMVTATDTVFGDYLPGDACRGTGTGNYEF